MTKLSPYKYSLLVTIVLICCAGCAKKKDIVGSYNLIQSTAAVSEVDEFQQSILDAEKQQHSEVITLFNDKHYTIINNANDYSQGIWKYTEKFKTILFEPDRLEEKRKVGTIDLTKQPYTILIQDVDKNQKSIYSHSIFEDSSVYNHPFYPTNNQWRISAQENETDEQIKERLAMYLKHLALILKSSMTDKSDVVSFQYSQGPVAIYSGGIGVIPFDKIRPSWFTAFFDEADARKAYNLYIKAVKECPINGAGTGDWVADDYRILLAIYGTLKKTG